MHSRSGVACCQMQLGFLGAGQFRNRPTRNVGRGSNYPTWFSFRRFVSDSLVAWFVDFIAYSTLPDL